jgi:hypothetical protein
MYNLVFFIREQQEFTMQPLKSSVIEEIGYGRDMNAD